MRRVPDQSLCSLRRFSGGRIPVHRAAPLRKNRSSQTKIKIKEYEKMAPMRDYLSSVNLQKNRFFKKCRLGDLKNAFVLLLFEVI